MCVLSPGEGADIGDVSRDSVSGSRRVRDESNVLVTVKKSDRTNWITRKSVYTKDLFQESGNKISDT